MSSVLLVTPAPDFEVAVRAAYDNAIAEGLRYWDDALLDGNRREAVERLAGTGTDVIVIGPGIPVDTILDLARIFDREHPEVVVAIVTEARPDLWGQAVRAGVRDVIPPGAPPEELRATFDEILRTAQGRRERFRGNGASASREPVSSTRIIAVLSPKGGSGKTTVATNLAVGLAHAAPHEVVLIDLDLQFGDVASALRLTPESTIADTVRTALDTTTLKVLLTPHPTDLFTLCAPESLAQADDVDPERLAKIVRPLASEFKYVVIDTAAGIDPHALAAIELATDLIMVCTTDVPCVRGVRKALDALDVLGMGGQARHFVLNRADAKLGLSASDIESTLGVELDVTVPSSQAMWLSLNSGTPILESDSGSPAGRAMAELVERFVPGSLAAATGGRRSSGGRRRRKG